MSSGSRALKIVRPPQAATAAVAVDGNSTPTSSLPSGQSASTLQVAGGDAPTSKLCKNIAIYGHCKFADKGCVFSHDVEAVSARFWLVICLEIAKICMRRQRNHLAFYQQQLQTMSSHQLRRDRLRQHLLQAQHCRLLPRAQASSCRKLRLASSRHPASISRQRRPLRMQPWRHSPQT